MDEAEVERLKAVYSDWSDAELRRVATGAGGFTPEAIAAAESILHLRASESSDNSDDNGIAYDDDALDRCDCCGSAIDVQYVPFVAARNGGQRWERTIASIALSAALIPLAGFGLLATPNRRVLDPVILWLGICPECEAAWSDSSSRLTAEAYTHYPEYATLEASGYDVIIDEHEMTHWGFARLERRFP